MPAVNPRPEYRVKPETLWKQDDQVEAARRLPGWAEFHRRCGENNLFFDHIEREGKRGTYRVTAYSLHDRRTHMEAYGTGNTPVEALADAYHGAGQPVACSELARLLNGDPAIDLDQLLGGADVSLEDILG